MRRTNSLQRWIDYWFGIIILAILGVFTKKRPFPKNIKRIALFKSAAIGDLVLLEPIIRAAKLAYPDAEIVLLAGTSNYKFAKASIKNINIVEITIKKPLLAIKHVRAAGHFDLFIDFGQWSRLEAIVTFFANSSYRIGFKSIQQHRQFIYDDYYEHSDKQHEMINYLGLAKLAGVVADDKPRFTRLAEKLDNYIIIHMFGTRQSHKWANSNWLAVSKYFIDKGYRIAFTGTVYDFIGNDEITNSGHEILSGLSYEDLLSELSKASLLITVNTGIMHIAAALDVAIVTIYGRSRPERWGAISNSSINVLSDRCHGCEHFGFEKCNKDIKCMDYIQVESVISAANDLLNKSKVVK